MIEVGIVGASGYTGGELIRILAGHPEARVRRVSSRTYAGKKIGEVFQSLWDRVDLTCEDLSSEEMASRCDLVFTAVPHGAAMPIAPTVRAAGKKMVDLGADFRFDDASIYESWYKVKHEQPGLLEESVYGLPELNRDRVRKAWLVGNPGCYPTTVVLGLAPLLRAGAIDTAGIIIDAKSGVSGAGRKPGLAYHYPERNDSLAPYGVAGHRHTPEIEQELSKLAGKPVTVTFTPHLVPLTRGMLSTIYASPVGNCPSCEELAGMYHEFYRRDHFVRVLPPDRLPETKAVCGSNFCDISLRVDSRTNRVIIMSAIDNLVKGASGQAVQNMNLMFGLDEKTGLDMMPVYP
ncbi:MAG: N-acetyl-gamma-glutamyl-phosphate reductase [Clostridia bacterium]|nr:N-acetyl-gamma-glutamyl-phosphate reductase [Clostridia bacterium]